MSNDQWNEGGEQPSGSAASHHSRAERDAQAALYSLAKDALKEKRRSRRWKIFFRLAWLLLVVAVFASIYSSMRSGSSSTTSSGDFVGVVELEGMISSDSEVNAKRIIEGIDKAYDSKAKAVVVHINSPGGTPVQAARIYDEIMRLRKEGKKPIYAVIEDLGASGAYYVASGADKIYAAPASLVGSIGVIYSGFGFEDILKKAGVERRVFTAGENKDFLDPFKGVTPHQQQFWQHLLDVTHQQFINDVKKGRGDRLKDDPELFSGLVWSGEQARELGLIDEVKTFDQVIREQVGSTDNTVDFTPSSDPFDRIGKRIGVMASSALGLSASSTVAPLRAEMK
ncbi:hypothetical protein R84981_000856 [Carnimonas sp. R-84981]|uniref:signal peptide peptidase SppA n=1 Tax=Carnimonas bestiolae TaxID=3402172 RepID=UPI003EDB92C4